MSVHEELLRKAVFEALDNAAENGYKVDESSIFEARELIECDATVEELLGLDSAPIDTQPTSAQVIIVASYVEDWKRVKSDVH